MELKNFNGQKEKEEEIRDFQTLNERQWNFAVIID